MTASTATNADCGRVRTNAPELTPTPTTSAKAALRAPNAAGEARAELD